MITEKDVKNVAELSRIHLQDEEIPQLTKNLEDILVYIHKLSKLDVTHVEPTSHGIPIRNVYRPDAVRPSLTQEEALKFSVEQSNGFFKVPKVIE